jgi:hypothetical protein
METLDNGAISAQVQFSPKALSDLSSTTPWMKFLAILGFIVTGFMLLASLGIFAMASQLGAAFAGIGIFYLLFSGLYGYLSLLLFQQASNIRSYLVVNDIFTMETYFAKQKTFWMIIGIMVLVSIIFTIVFLVFFASTFAMLMSNLGSRGRF